MKWLRKEKARECPVHQTILDCAQESLVEYGYFNKEDVLEKTGMTAMAESIRWDYIAEFIRDELGEETIPLAQAFWSGSPEDKANKRRVTSPVRQLSPGKYIAGGHGKKTAGYALVSIDNGALALKKLANKRSLANGVGKSFRAFAQELENRHMLEGSQRKLADSITN